MQAEMLKIVAGVDDDGEVRADQSLQPKRELGAADAAAQCHHRPAAMT